jgi:hypothetical protein
MKGVSCQTGKRSLGPLKLTSPTYSINTQLTNDIAGLANSLQPPDVSVSLQLSSSGGSQQQLYIKSSKIPETFKYKLGRVQFVLCGGGGGGIISWMQNYKILG